MRAGRSAAALAAAALLLACGAPAAEERRAEATRLMQELMSGTHPIGASFTLSDPAGRRVSLADFKGKLVMLYFGFASCPDVCPTDLASVGVVLRSLGPLAEQVQPIFVTLDPARDTPDVLRGYAKAFHPKFVALTGTEDEVRRVATDFKVYFAKVALPGTGSYMIEHTAYTFLLDREGEFVILFPPGTPPERMLEMLRQQLSAAPLDCCSAMSA